MDKIDKKIDDTICFVRENSTQLIYDVIESCRWYVDNMRIEGFIFSDFDHVVGESEPHRLISFKMRDIQVSELNELCDEIQKIPDKYGKEDTLSMEMRVDNEGAYIELLICDFS